MIEGPQIQVESQTAQEIKQQKNKKMKETNTKMAKTTGFFVVYIFVVVADVADVVCL